MNKLRETWETWGTNTKHDDKQNLYPNVQIISQQDFKTFCSQSISGKKSLPIPIQPYNVVQHGGSHNTNSTRYRILLKQTTHRKPIDVSKYICLTISQNLTSNKNKCTRIYTSSFWELRARARGAQNKTWN